MTIMGTTELGTPADEPSMAAPILHSPERAICLDDIPLGDSGRRVPDAGGLLVSLTRALFLDVRFDDPANSDC